MDYIICFSNTYNTYYTYNTYNTLKNNKKTNKIATFCLHLFKRNKMWSVFGSTFGSTFTEGYQKKVESI